MDRLFLRSSGRSVLWLCYSDFYALIYMYVGFFSGYAFRIYYDDDIKVPMLLTAVMDLFYNLAVYGLAVSSSWKTGTLYIFLQESLFRKCFIQCFLLMIVYQIFHYINYQIS